MEYLHSYRRISGLPLPLFRKSRRITDRMFRAVPLTLRASRGFSTGLVRRNVIQELYLKELKSVHLKPVTAADAQGSVKPWTPPAAPKIPELELQSADALKEYASSEVETVKEATEQAAEVEEGDWLVLEEIEDDHHH
ncbi:ATP synthase subunit H [Kluyveromyces marxianus]|uniref:ATP synthase subunit H n=1 Tax=Kluyveromyces marxianus TaxID=4911 RepID=A0ABX6EQ91_KLUMA|nr:ATP synthase subunit H [Kluyveromyces marxianus]BAP69412.1 ATP synthase subunit H [Kluyveromyces marxianus]